MTPISGFFEYGLAAVLGTVVLIGLTAWSLIADDSMEVGDRFVEMHGEDGMPLEGSEKKAA